MGMFSKSFQGFTSWIDPATAFIGRATGISNYLVKQTPYGKPPPLMPDQQTLLQEQTLQESRDAALRYGRAATVLSNPGVGGGDKLGP